MVSVTERPEGMLQVATAWDDAIETMPTLAANVFSVQVTGAGAPEEVVMSVGYAAPPVLAGTPEEQQRQAASLESVTIRPVVRLSMTPGRLRELLTVLQGVADGLQNAAPREDAP